jgi:hypothetical protein
MEGLPASPPRRRVGQRRAPAESYYQDEIGRLERECGTLRGLVEEMTLQHKLEEILRRHPVLAKLKGRLSEIKDVERMEAEAISLIEAIQEAGGSSPSEPTPRAASVSSSSTPGAPTGPLNEDTGSPPLDRVLSESEDTFSRARAHRKRQRESSQARASSLGE